MKEDEILRSLRQAYELIESAEYNEAEDSNETQEEDLGQRTGRKIALVACVKTKRSAASPARALYASPLFTKASSYAQQIADGWYILSAKHGLVHPDAVIAPYNKTLNRMRVAERREWARKVLAELGDVLQPGDEVVILAGKRYRENLVTPITRMGCSIKIPMEGLSFGQQLRWLSQHRDSASE